MSHRMAWELCCHTRWTIEVRDWLHLQADHSAPAERQYTQLDFGVKKFHQFLLRRKFTILSDHRPLQHLLSEIKAIASSRIKQWALTLSAYDYKICYKPGKDHANADVLSCLPLLEHPKNIPQPGETMLLIESLNTTPVNAKHVKEWTKTRFYPKFVPKFNKETELLMITHRLNLL